MVFGVLAQQRQEEEGRLKVLEAHFQATVSSSITPLATQLSSLEPGLTALAEGQTNLNLGFSSLAEGQKKLENAIVELQSRSLFDSSGDCMVSSSFEAEFVVKKQQLGVCNQKIAEVENQVRAHRALSDQRGEAYSLQLQEISQAVREIGSQSQSQTINLGRVKKKFWGK